MNQAPTNNSVNDKKVGLMNQAPTTNKISSVGCLIYQTHIFQIQINKLGLINQAPTNNSVNDKRWV